MQLNFINKAYLVLACMLVISIVFRVFHYKRWERYYYYGSISAPASYPVYVREAYFITADAGEHRWLNQQEVNTFATAWGDEYFFPEAGSPMRLPEKLILSYASYRDRKFYRDTFALPLRDIETLFDKALKNKTASELYSSSGDKAGLRFVLGIANDGNIVLWLRGEGFEQVVLRAVLPAREPQGDDTYYGHRMSKEDYLRQVFSALPDSLKALMDKGWEAGASYKDSTSYYLTK